MEEVLTAQKTVLKTHGRTVASHLIWGNLSSRVGHRWANYGRPSAFFVARQESVSSKNNSPVILVF